MIDKNISSTSKGYELVNFCEFDKYATKSYCAIHNVDESLNLGDITKVDEKGKADNKVIAKCVDDYLKKLSYRKLNGDGQRINGKVYRVFQNLGDSNDS